MSGGGEPQPAAPDGETERYRRALIRVRAQALALLARAGKADRQAAERILATVDVALEIGGRDGA